MKSVNKKEQAVIMEILKDKVLHPNKYLWMVNVPGAFDAAEYLYFNHFDSLQAKHIKACESILLKSGRYIMQPA